RIVTSVTPATMHIMARTSLMRKLRTGIRARPRAQGIDCRTFPDVQPNCQPEVGVGRDSVEPCWCLLNSARRRVRTHTLGYTFEIAFSFVCGRKSAIEIFQLPHQRPYS